MVLRHEDLLFLARVFLGAYGDNFTDLTARCPPRRQSAEPPGGGSQTPARPLPR